MPLNWVLLWGYTLESVAYFFIAITPIWPKMVVTVRILSMNHMDLFEIIRIWYDHVPKKKSS